MGKFRSLIAFFFLSICAQAITPEGKPLVQVKSVTSEPYFDKLIYPARIESRVNSLVTADVEGWVKKIKKPIGSAVRRGEIVLFLENQDPVYTFASIPVRSPATGFVSGFSVSLSSKVNRGEKLFMVTDPKTLKVTAEVPSSDLAALHVGDSGIFRAQFNAKTEYKITITGLSPLVDARTGTAHAEFEFTDGTPRAAELPIGVLGQASFNTQARSVYLLPDSALNYVDGKPFVRVLENEKMRRQMVDLGFQSNDDFEIKSGIKDGDQVIVRANKFIKEGQEVEVEKSDKVQAR